MHKRRASWRVAVLAVLAAVAIIAAGCVGDGSDSATPPPTPEREPLALLTPTPGAAAPITPADTAPTATDQLPPATPDDSFAPRPLDCLPLRNRAALLLMPLLEQSELGLARSLAAQGDLGGIALLGTPDSGLAAELASLQAASKFASVLVASDEEGGTVQRLTNVIWPLPSAQESATTRTPDEVRQLWTDYGTAARALGVHVILGPVLDVGGGPGIASRSFGEDPAVVTTYGGAVADGLRQAGVLPVYKHFPGHGRATADSHLLLPTTPSIDELRLRDLVPYAELLADPSIHDQIAVMVGHLAVPGLSGDTPTSLSPATITDLLRGEFGFTGIVFTDALNMGAIVDTYGPLEALERSINAGADIAIIGSLADVTPALDYLVERATASPEFAAVIDNRAERVLLSRGDGSICAGAQ